MPDVVSSYQCRCALVTFIPGDIATLVSKSWRSAKHQQTTRLKCHYQITDGNVKALANEFPKLTEIDLIDTQVGDTGAAALANGCPNLRRRW